MERHRPSFEVAAPGKEMLGLGKLSDVSAGSEVGRLETVSISECDAGICDEGEAVGDGDGDCDCDISLTGTPYP